MLDPVPWTITNYNWETGDCTLVRGIQKIEIADQFVISEEQQKTPEKKDVHSNVFKRSPIVRRNVLIRSEGKCEYCDKIGFIMRKDRIYVETHHIQQLSEKGKDCESNVAALCPDHHREAHYGINKKRIKQELVKKMQAIYPNLKVTN
jgi:predicted HNH restriction endonuclease